MTECRCSNCESLFHREAQCPRIMRRRRPQQPVFEIARGGVVYKVRAATYEAAERRLDHVLSLVA